MIVFLAYLPSSYVPLIDFDVVAARNEKVIISGIKFHVVSHLSSCWNKFPPPDQFRHPSSKYSDRIQCSGSGCRCCSSLLLWYPQNDQCRFASLESRWNASPSAGEEFHSLHSLRMAGQFKVEIIYKQRVSSCEMSKQSFINKTTGRMVLNQSTLRVITINHAVRT
jgi:hypothetical protein